MKKEAECLIKFLNDKEGRLFTEEKKQLKDRESTSVSYQKELKCKTSLLLFIMVMDSIIKDCGRRCKNLIVGNWRLAPIKLSSLAFADNVAVLADSLEKLQFNMKIYEKELRKRGLKVSISKTKSMVVSKEESHHISPRGANVEQAHDQECGGGLHGRTTSSSTAMKGESPRTESVD
ncbi:hypothetical protein ILUMI_16121 [Ignelater luminosus]|uniref:Reverse transcriptase domain-containing protein n=1 Tax=Ignelater luminosus TaxID=2038154 RepID=A0A8K0G690_IGNLU|nr:hypothetical protein ILUMI_16121 [Ignelater luminosus]